jgi:hypothetical protein
VATTVSGKEFNFPRRREIACTKSGHKRILTRQYDIWNAIQRFRGIKSELIDLFRKPVVLSCGLKQKLRNKEVDI